MTYDEVMQSLEKAGTAQNQKIFAKHGAHEPMFGVSWAHMGTLTKRIKRDQDLALALWKSGNYDARLLATMVAEPAMLDSKTLDRWAKDLDCYPAASAFAKLVMQSPLATEKMRQWKDSKAEFIGQAGWDLQAYHAARESSSESEVKKILNEIEQKIHASANRVKHSMMMTLISIGARGGKLKTEALAAHQRIGKVEIDHGDTSCKTPEPKAYIEKMLARKAKSTTSQAKASA
jgi:3-methyladenine DNA glycosylase AlkD